MAGLTLLALYGPDTPVGINVAYTRTAVALALLFVTLPFVVRTVQPVLHELATEMEEAAASLGARKVAIFRRIVLPNLFPAILSGVALAFARAIGEFGAVVLISGNLPFKTQVASVYMLGEIESGQVGAPRELYDHPTSEFVMTFLGPVNRLGDSFVRPHDVEIELEPNGSSRRAVVERVVHPGFEVRVDLALESGERLSVQVTRGTAESWHFEPGQSVFVRPGWSKVFA